MGNNHRAECLIKRQSTYEKTPEFSLLPSKVLDSANRDSGTGKARGGDV